VRLPVCARVDMREARDPRLCALHELHRMMDVAERP
jgi:hypothetical protein